MEFTHRMSWKYNRVTYIVTLTLGELNGQLAPIGIRVEQIPRPRQKLRPISSDLLRHIPIQRLVTRALAEERLRSTLSQKPLPPLSPRFSWSPAPLDETFHANREQFWQEQKELAPRVLELIKSTGQGNGRRWGDEHYAQVLEVYEDAKRFQQPTTKAVMDAFGLSEKAALQHVHRAKEKAKGATRQRGRK